MIANIKRILRLTLRNYRYLFRLSSSSSSRLSSRLTPSSLGNATPTDPSFTILSRPGYGRGRRDAVNNCKNLRRRRHEPRRSTARIETLIPVRAKKPTTVKKKEHANRGPAQEGRKKQKRRERSKTKPPCTSKRESERIRHCKRNGKKRRETPALFFRGGCPVTRNK